jgi:hypothetical protein
MANSIAMMDLLWNARMDRTGGIEMTFTNMPDML